MCFVLLSFLLFSHSVCVQLLQPHGLWPSRPFYGFSQARILEWVAIFFRRSTWPKDWTCFSCTAGRFFTSEPPGKPFLFLYQCPFTKIFPFSHHFISFLPQFPIPLKLIISFKIYIPHSRVWHFFFPQTVDNNDLKNTLTDKVSPGYYHLKMFCILKR